MMSALESALADLRITGAVMLHERYAPGVAIAVPAEAELRALLGHAPNVKIAPFHLVRRGGFELALAGGEKVAMGISDVAVCLDGKPHQLRFGRARSVTPLADIVSGRADLSPVNGDCAAELICGVFAMQAAPLNPLLAALPPVLRCKTRGEAVQPLLAMASEMLATELDAPARGGASFTRARLLEVFFAEAIRANEQTAAAPVGWFRGLTDARISAALTAFHQAPGEAWTVERLADRAALSPSRFAARFRDSVGVTAMEYVARWRLNLTCRMLEDPGKTLDAIAHAVGYGGGAALSRAFKEKLGCSPAHWRAS
ncbi:MAG TPA: hypothetical protein DHW63_13100 [Hyphomonadaceae bacterium]|nr:hypothetical protein [Hyphomonadaceae bacterium]